MNLSTYTKKRLKEYVCALSANDVSDTAITHLIEKNLLTTNEKESDTSLDRCVISIYLLTDDGIRAVKKYIPNYWPKDENNLI